MTLYDSIDEIPERHQEIVSDNVGSDEFIKGVSVLYGDFKRYWPRLVVTDRKLVWCYNTLMHQNVKSWPLGQITDIEGQRGVSYAIVIRTASGNEEKFTLKSEDGEDFYQALNDAYVDVLNGRKAEVND